MSRVSTRLAAVGIAAAGLAAWTVSPSAQSGAREPVSIAQFDRWMEELSNWGRWGGDDQIGAANLMTEAKRLEAAALVRTGATVSLSVGPTREMSGWDASVIPFLAERDIALLGADSVHEAPNSVPGLRVNPIHRFAIVARGMNLLDNIDLDAAAEVAARLDRWEFMLVVAPLRVPGGTGSPVNPIAIF